jgi:hypothetical protein
MVKVALGEARKLARGAEVLRGPICAGLSMQVRC